MKIRAAHAATPDDDSEKVIVFAPGRRLRACSCSDVSLSVFAYRIFNLLPENEKGTLARNSGEDAGCVLKDASRACSSGIGTCADEAS
jgi:hypothetical protein